MLNCVVCPPAPGFIFPSLVVSSQTRNYLHTTLFDQQTRRISMFLSKRTKRYLCSCKRRCKVKKISVKTFFYDINKELEGISSKFRHLIGKIMQAGMITANILAFAALMVLFCSAVQEETIGVNRFDRVTTLAAAIFRAIRPKAEKPPLRILQ